MISLYGDKGRKKNREGTIKKGNCKKKFIDWRVQNIGRKGDEKGRKGGKKGRKEGKKRGRKERREERRKGRKEGRKGKS